MTNRTNWKLRADGKRRTVTPTRGALQLLKRTRKRITEPGGFTSGMGSGGTAPHATHCLLGWMSTLDPYTGNGGVAAQTVYPNNEEASSTYRIAAAIIVETINSDAYKEHGKWKGRPMIADSHIINLNDGPGGRDKIISALDRTIRYLESAT